MSIAPLSDAQRAAVRRTAAEHRIPDDAPVLHYARLLWNHELAVRYGRPGSDADALDHAFVETLLLWVMLGRPEDYYAPHRTRVGAPPTVASHPNIAEAELALDAFADALRTVLFPDDTSVVQPQA